MTDDDEVELIYGKKICIQHNQQIHIKFRKKRTPLTVEELVSLGMRQLQ